MIYATPGQTSRGSGKRALLPVRVSPCPVKGTGMQWFRFYSEALDDPKVQRLPGDLFKAWVNLLCLANEQAERGTLPSLDDIAFRLRLDYQKAEDALLGLKRAGLLELDQETDSYVIHAWAKRQPPSDIDSTATERKRRERERKTQQPGQDQPVTRDVTRDMSQRHGPVTGDVTRLEKSRVEKSREEERRPSRGQAAPKGVSPLRPVPKPKDAPAPRNEQWDALIEVTGIAPQTATERSLLGKVSRELRDAGKSGPEIISAGENYRERWPDVDLTWAALAKHFTLNEHPPPVRALPTREAPGRASGVMSDDFIQRMKQSRPRGEGA